MQGFACLCRRYGYLVSLFNVPALASLLQREQFLARLLTEVVLAYDALLRLQFGYVLILVVGHEVTYYAHVVGSRRRVYHYAVRIFRSHLHRRVQC